MSSIYLLLTDEELILEASIQPRPIDAVLFREIWRRDLMARLLAMRIAEGVEVVSR